MKMMEWVTLSSSVKEQLAAERTSDENWDDVVMRLIRERDRYRDALHNATRNEL